MKDKVTENKVFNQLQEIILHMLASTEFLYRGHNFFIVSSGQIVTSTTMLFRENTSDDSLALSCEIQ